MAGMFRRAILLACLALGVAVSVSGCSKAQAKTPGPAPVALVMPEPPTRLQIPVEALPPPPPPVSSDKPAPSSPPVKPRPAQPPPTTTTPPPATPPTETAPPPVVQTGAQAEFEALAKEKLTAAERNLGRVQRLALGNEARDQFDAAERFVKMAKGALQVKNYVLAAYCADKAATLAALLVKLTDRATAS